MTCHLRNLQVMWFINIVSTYLLVNQHFVEEVAIQHKILHYIRGTSRCLLQRRKIIFLKYVIRDLGIRRENKRVLSFLLWYDKKRKESFLSFILHMVNIFHYSNKNGTVKIMKFVPLSGITALPSHEKWTTSFEKEGRNRNATG